MPRRCAVWKEAGTRLRLERMTVQPEADGHRVRIHTLHHDSRTGCRWEAIYTIQGDGRVTVENTFIPGAGPLPELPRLGLSVLVRGDCERASWFGRGPWENYADRKTSAFMGCWEMNVSDLFHPYLRPQETGNRCDIRWLTLKDETGRGLRVEGQPFFEYSALHFRVEDLDPGLEKGQTHAAELKPRPEIQLVVGAAQMGVGGDTSWGDRPHPPYLIPLQTTRFTFVLSGQSPEGLARTPEA